MEENKANVRKYLPGDRSAVLELLQLNTPIFFSPAESKDLEYYLDHEIESYFVLEINGVVTGSGGINYSEDKKTGIISWDMIHPFYHGKGLGSILLKHRLKLLQTTPLVEKIRVRTSQHTFHFYEKSGFVVLNKVPDYWADGFDMIEMEYKGITHE
ncbi:MAG: GNAT family N-acetyltransferase [Bacteroidetes bacterium]|nr:GNAT family N-acetyltransferase [Bacteroidota bacterium]MBK9046898.1 GNAT family N-acetyltransferase [Bacteroidota bacterium]